MSTTTKKTEMQSTINSEIAKDLQKIVLTTEQKKVLSETVKKQNEAKVKKMQNSSFWNLKQALQDKGSETDKLDLKLEKISSKVQRKLRNSFLRPEQKKLASAFLGAFNMSQVSNTKETEVNLQIAFSNFNTFNKKYLNDCKVQFSQKSEDNEERKQLDLAYSYYFELSK